MLRLSFLFGSTASGTTPAPEQILDADHSDVPWVTTGELREAEITATLRGVSAEILATTPALRLHPEGALLIAMYGATIGRTAILRVPAASNQAVCALSRPTGCDVEYVELALQASRERLMLKAVGGGQPNINQETVRAFRIPVPPLEEQRAIVAYVKEQTAHINAAMTNAMRCADLARERRAALISAAVTGKIDVGVSA
nr:restriction endonuclease subunit S [Tessaracoccus sp. MC1627]